MITYPLNNIDYTAEDAELFHCTRTSGIWAEDSFPISVTGADNNITIGKGIAWINNEEFSGKVTALKSAEVLDLGIADSTYSRIDVIAIQFNANNNATDVIVKKGTPASNPVRPAIVRNGAVYELYIASVYRPAGATAITASNITDLRMNETVCGLMADAVTKVDMTAIEAQVKAFINKLQSEVDSIKDLSGLMLKSDWADGDVIPIRKGGTGAKTAEDALIKLGGISKTILWQNASPASAFSAQSIPVPCSEYGEIVVEYSFSTTYKSLGEVSCKYGAGNILSMTSITSISSDNAYGQFNERLATINANQIVFTNTSYKSATGVGYGITSTLMIPLRIYGIKGVQ